METPLLNRLKNPETLKKFKFRELEQLAQEIRERISSVVREVGGHLGPNLGVVEILIACHYIFNFKSDRLVFDVGHQSYPHKLLSGRDPRFLTLRQKAGISGYPSQHESPYDVFRGGHASTAISTALGLKRGYTIAKVKPDPNVIALVGDGSMTGGMAFEGLNHTGYLGDPLIVILNDNSMSISPTVGALGRAFNSIRYTNLYRNLRDTFQSKIRYLPKVGDRVRDFTDLVLKEFQTMINPSQIFTALGFEYMGPFDGHDIRLLIKTLRIAKKLNRPVLIHALTQKGLGYHPNGKDSTPIIGPHALAATPQVKMSAAKTANAKATDLTKSVPPKKTESYSAVFAGELLHLAKRRKKIVAITAAMRDGTGLKEFSETLPDQYFDVGICEAHATGFSAGLSSSRHRPVFAVYSTFLQRAFDQIFHDVILQAKLPVIFAIDRAGLVGDDGPSHHGLYDIAYLRIFPNMILMAPKDAAELRAMLAFALQQKHPVAIRYPKSPAPGDDFFSGGAPAHVQTNKSPAVAMRHKQTPVKQTPIVWGRAETLQRGSRLCIIAYGSMVEQVHNALAKLPPEIAPTFINARFAKPIDPLMVRHAFKDHTSILTVEEGITIGGLGAGFLETAEELNLNVSNVSVKRLGVPDRLIEHASRREQLATCGLDIPSLQRVIKTLWKQTSPPPQKNRKSKKRAT